MVASCCVLNCRRTIPLDKKEPRLSLHRFPTRNLEIRKKWIKAAGLGRPKDWKPKDHHVVCSVHFNELDYYPDQQMRRLREEAVPSNFVKESYAAREKELRKLSSSEDKNNGNIENALPSHKSVAGNENSMITSSSSIHANHGQNNNNLQQPDPSVSVCQVPPVPIICPENTNIPIQNQVLANPIQYMILMPNLISINSGNEKVQTDETMNSIPNTVSVDTLIIGQHNIAAYKTLCRLCGVSRESSFDIFDTKHHYSYDKVINSHFKEHFLINKSDILPSRLCSLCRTKLTTWHEFYHSCLVVNKKFQQLVKKLDLSKEHDVKESEAKANDIEVIEVTVDNIAENYDLMNESNNPKPFDISNINIQETHSLALSNTSDNEFDPLDDSPSSDTDEEPADKNTSAELITNETQKGKTNNERKSKNKKKSTVCRICGKLYTNRSTYLKHLEKWHSTHRGPKPPKKRAASAAKSSSSGAKKSNTGDGDKNALTEMCYKCGKCFKHKSSYRNHLKFVHASNPQTVQKPRTKRMCEMCGKVCSSSGLRSHMLRHTNPEVLKCHECDRVFAFPSTLKSHVRVCHTKDRPHECSMCPSTFKRADYLRSHIRYKHSDMLDNTGILKCEFCDNIYKTRKYYLLHLKTHDSGDDRQKPVPKPKKSGSSSFHCDECNLDFKKRNYYMLHHRYVHVRGQPYSISESAEGQYQCDKCDRRFSSVSGRNYHCRKVHDSVFDMNFSAKCDHCGLTFRNRVFYARHQAKIAGVPTCYLCGEAFGSEEQLTKHMDENHSSDLPFVCDICRTRFVALKNLNHHLRTRHFNDKPYQCDLCEHRTTRKDALSIHIRATHLGEKPFQCTLCGRRFSQKTDLRKHEVRHTRDK